MRRHWEGSGSYTQVPRLLKGSRRRNELVEPDRSATEAQFDSQKNLKLVRVDCLPERMKYSVERFTVSTFGPDGSFAQATLDIEEFVEAIGR